MPKWGFSKSDYFFDKEKNVIAKGLSSVKYISDGLAEELYELAHSRTYARFTDVLYDVDRKSSLNTKQLDILIKLDFFSEFGNQRELLRMTEMFYDVFKKGEAKKIAKDRVDGTQLEPIIQKYATGVTKTGQFAKAYTLLDVKSILYAVEDAIKAVHMEDLPDSIKIRNFAEVMGYAGYTSGREEDRKKLYVQEVYPVCRRRDGKQFGYNVLTRSVGSGKETKFTVYMREFEREPIRKGDILYCDGWRRSGKYYDLTAYHHLT